MRFFRIIFIFALLFCAVSASPQQISLQRSVMASGGSTSQEQNFRIASTVGQPFVGRSIAGGTQIISGFWYSDQDFATHVDHASEQIPEEFSLQQNYPNPFNPSTTIVFELPESAEIKLVLYDLLGRKVLTLKDENIAAGSYDFTFEASRLPSGVYFYRLVAKPKGSPVFVATRKLTLVK